MSKFKPKLFIYWLVTIVMNAAVTTVALSVVPWILHADWLFPICLLLAAQSALNDILHVNVEQFYAV